MTNADTPCALITGSAKRLGAELARALHALGHDVVIHYRESNESAAILCAELEARRTGSTLCLQADLADLDQLPVLIDKTLNRFGRLDVLINNASSFFPTPIGATTAAHWQDLFSSNAQAPFFLSQAAANALRESRGCIVNLIDLYARQPLPGHTVYCMAKSALAMMTLAMAQELAPDIRVNGVAPGAILWPEFGKDEKHQAAILAHTPLARVGTPQDIVKAVRFLVCDAPFVKGQILSIDGGRALQL